MVIYARFTTSQRRIVERMKLQQGQIWKCAGEYVRIVHLERLEVGYKSFKNLKTQEGVHQHTSKKDFCRLLKGAMLLSSDKKVTVDKLPQPAKTPKPTGTV
jgi:hypothetical protein